VNFATAALCFVAQFLQAHGFSAALRSCFVFLANFCSLAAYIVAPDLLPDYD